MAARKKPLTENEIRVQVEDMPLADLIAFHNKITGKSLTRFRSRENGEKQTLKAWRAQLGLPQPSAKNPISREGAAAPKKPKAKQTPIKPSQVPYFGKPKALKRSKPKAPSKSLFDGLPPQAAEPEPTPVPDTGRRAPETVLTGRRHGERRSPPAAATASKHREKKPGPFAFKKDVFQPVAPSHGGARFADSRGPAIESSWKDPAVRAARSVRDKVRVVGGETYRSFKVALESLEIPLTGHLKLRKELKAKGELKHAGYVFKIVNNLK